MPFSCSFCSHPNPAGSRFCNQCGSPLNLTPCPVCDAVNDLEAVHCHRCEATLRTEAVSEPAAVDGAGVQTVDEAASRPEFFEMYLKPLRRDLGTPSESQAGEADESRCTAEAGVEPEPARWPRIEAAQLALSPQVETPPHSAQLEGPEPERQAVQIEAGALAAREAAAEQAQIRGADAQPKPTSLPELEPAAKTPVPAPARSAFADAPLALRPASIGRQLSRTAPPRLLYTACVGSLAIAILAYG